MNTHASNAEGSSVTEVDVIRAISLERTPERFARLLADNPGLPIERFCGVDGATLDREKCIQEGWLGADNDYIPGALGTAASHLSLWLACTKIGKPLHIIEDDVILRSDFCAMARRCLAAVPQWDIVLWAHNLDWPLKVQPIPGICSSILQYAHVALNEVREAFQAGEYMPALLKLESAAGLCAYSVSPAGAQRLMQACLPLGSTPAEYVVTGKGWINSGLDVEMARHYLDLNAYVAVPPLAMPVNDQIFSTIRGHLASVHDLSAANKALGG